MPTAAVWYGAAPVFEVAAEEADEAAEEVALDKLAEAPLVTEASLELRLDETDPVALASEELSAEDSDESFELTEDETEEITDEIEDETLLAALDDWELLELDAEAALLDSELDATELELEAAFVVVWACG